MGLHAVANELVPACDTVAARKATSVDTLGSNDVADLDLDALRVVDSKDEMGVSLSWEEDHEEPGA